LPGRSARDEGPLTTNVTHAIPAWARRFGVPAALCLGGALLIGPLVHLGWMPMDDGLLAHSAQRVLQGDLPHRDFDDVYTGGLAMLDAAAFRALGAGLFTLRVPLLIAFALWTTAVYSVAKRFTSTAGAALVAMVAAVWNIGSYPNAGPSWYTLFLFTGGTAALCAYVERRRAAWLFVAGFAGGLAISIKVIGLYYVAAALLFFVFLEQQDHRAAAGPDASGARAGRAYSVIVTCALLAFVAVLFRLVRHLVGVFGPPLHFVVPSAALAAVLIAREWRSRPSRPTLPRMKQLLSVAVPFLAGVSLPVAMFVLPYVMSGATRALIYGVFILPQKRFQYAAYPPASLRTIGWAIPWLVLLTVPSRLWKGCRAAIIGVALVAAALPMVIDGGVAYRSLWRSFNHLDWVVVLVGAWLIARPETLRRVPPPRQAALWLILCMSALCSLVRFPNAGAFYFLFFAPLALLAALAVVTTREGGAGPVPTIVAVMLIVVGVACVDARRFDFWGNALPPLSSLVPIGGPRGGISVPPGDSGMYAHAVRLLKDHTVPDGYAYAGPDMPEMYFLAGLRDPTRTMYDFFDDPATHDARVLQAIDAHHVTAVTINTGAMWSPPMDAVLRDALRQRFPDSVVTGSLIVRWRGAATLSRSTSSDGVLVP
jgi:hypothetical protein